MSNTNLQTGDTIKQLILARRSDSVLTDGQFQSIADLINRYVNDGKRPLYVYCTVTGSKCAMTAKQLFIDRLAQFDGNIVNMMTQYVGRGGGAKLRKIAKAQATGSERLAKKLDKSAKKLANKQARKLVTTRAPQPVVEQPDPYVQYKSLMPNGTFDWFWRHPSYVFRKEPRQFTLQEYIGLVSNTCHRTDLVCENNCNQCQFVLICGCKCKTVRDGRGNKVKLDAKGNFPRSVYDDLVDQYPDVNRIGVDYFLSQQLPK